VLTALRARCATNTPSAIFAHALELPGAPEVPQPADGEPAPQRGSLDVAGHGWTWLDMAACATAAVKVDEFAVGWDYWEALDVRVEAYKQSRRFTALYCRNHDQGALVEGVHYALPDSVNPCCVESATDCEYGAHQGTLTLTDEGNVDAEHFSEVDYSRYAGAGRRNTSRKKCTTKAEKRFRALTRWRVSLQIRRIAAFCSIGIHPRSSYYDQTSRWRHQPNDAGVDVRKRARVASARGHS
jgi:hypothetical protein